MTTDNQISSNIDAALNSALLNTSFEGQSKLSNEGNQLLSDFRAVLESYKQLGNAKNSDNIVQDALWSSSKADVDFNASVDSEIGKSALLMSSK